jgi:hypothetical protein
MAPVKQRGKAAGYEVRCSEELARALRAVMGPYCGMAGIFHWEEGYLWWLDDGMWRREDLIA